MGPDEGVDHSDGNVMEDKMTTGKKHPGFKAVASKIATKEGVSSKAAAAILAARTRSASPAARKANPHLNRVKG